MLGGPLLDECWLVVAGLRDVSLLHLLHLLNLLELLAVLDHSNWLSVCSNVLHYLLLPHNLMDWLLARYELIRSLYLNCNLPSPHLGTTQIMLTLELLDQTALHLTIISSFLSPHNASLRRSILRIYYNILCLIC